MSMLMMASRGELVVKFGKTVTPQDTERLAECLEAFKPLSQLTLDFRGMQVFDTSVMIEISMSLRGLQDVPVWVRALPPHQKRVLDRLRGTPSATTAGDPANDPA